MKTRTLLITFILSGLIQASAQDRNFNFGLKIAPAVSWLNADQKGLSSDGPLARLNWGFIGSYNFSENFALVSGFNINSLGGKLKFEYDENRLLDPSQAQLINGTVKSKNRYSELQIPALFQMKSNDMGGFKIYFQLGFAQGVFLTAKNGDGESIRSQTRPFNTSWVIASGIDFPVTGGISLLGQIKYNGGLTNVGKGDFSGVKASFIELGVGVLF